MYLASLVVFVFVLLASGGLPPLQIYTDPNAPVNGRYLAQEGNIPFFWTGDTPWELFNRLTYEDANVYLEDRQKKYYNILQVVGTWDLEVPNANGDYPFNPQLDPTQPNEKYWSYVDKLMDLVTDKGFYMAFWPTWGSRWISWGYHTPPVAIAFNPDNAYTFGLWIGNRLRNRTNIVWVLGGDIYFPIIPYTQVDTYRAMAEGIAQGVIGGPRPRWNDFSNPIWQKLLMSLHPTSGYSSSYVFNEDAWLRFNLIQSGWGHWQQIVPLIQDDYELPPRRPTFMGEGAYEWDIYTYCNMPNKTNDQWGVRFNSYWSVFAGGFGTTYGANGIYQFSDGWKQDLEYPGSGQIQYLRKLFEAHEWTKLVPDMDNTFVPLSASGNSTDCALVIGTYAYDGSFGFVYNTKGIPFQVNLGILKGSTVTASWYNPRTGVYTSIGNVSNKGLQSFVPPGTPGNENDWVLALVPSK